MTLHCASWDRREGLGFWSTDRSLASSIVLPLKLRCLSQCSSLEPAQTLSCVLPVSPSTAAALRIRRAPQRRLLDSFLQSSYARNSKISACWWEQLSMWREDQCVLLGATQDVERGRPHHLQVVHHCVSFKHSHLQKKLTLNCRIIIKYGALFIIFFWFTSLWEIFLKKITKTRDHLKVKKKIHLVGL